MADPQTLDIGKELQDLDIGAELSSLDQSPPPPQGTQPVAQQPQKKITGTSGDFLMTNEEWAKVPAGEKMRRVLEWGGKAISNAMGMGEPGQDAVEHPGMTLATAAIPLAVQKVPALLGISKARAVANLSGAAEAAQGAPVNAEGVGQVGLRALDLQAAGARTPRVVTQFMRRVTDPKLGDLTFEEARDFYSNLSRLSANETNSLNPTMQRQVAMMKTALHDALVNSAESAQAGAGQQYASGIREYARAAKATEAAKSAAKWGAGIAGAGVAGNYLLDRVLNAAIRTSGSR